jgi:hypothetical protein
MDYQMVPKSQGDDGLKLIASTGSHQRFLCCMLWFYTHIRTCIGINPITLNPKADQQIGEDRPDLLIPAHFETWHAFHPWMLSVPLFNGNHESLIMERIFQLPKSSFIIDSFGLRRAYSGTISWDIDKFTFLKRGETAIQLLAHHVSI